MCSNLLPNSSKIKISFTLVKLLKLILYLELHEYFGYNIFHENKILTPNNLSLKEAYDKCPKWVQDVWHDIYYIFDISNEQYETIFYGYSGQFDRDTLNYFYNKAENWCINGQLPPIK